MVKTKRQQRRIDRARVYLGNITMNNLHDYLDIKFSGYPLTCSQDDCLDNTEAWKREVANYQYWLETGTAIVQSEAPNLQDIILNELKSRPSLEVQKLIAEMRFMESKKNRRFLMTTNNKRLFNLQHQVPESSERKRRVLRVKDVAKIDLPCLSPLSPQQLQINRGGPLQHAYTYLTPDQFNDTSLSPSINYLDYATKQLYGHFDIEVYRNMLYDNELRYKHDYRIGLPPEIHDIVAQNSDSVTKMLLTGYAPSCNGVSKSYILPIDDGTHGVNPYSAPVLSRGFVPGGFQIYGMLSVLSIRMLLHLYYLTASFKRAYAQFGICVALDIDTHQVDSKCGPEGQLFTRDGRRRVLKRHKALRSGTPPPS